MSVQAVMLDIISEVKARMVATELFTTMNSNGG